MDEFSYLSVLLSVILGLAVTQILKGFRGLVLSRARIKIYWPVIVWAALLLLICFQSWWSMFGLRHRHSWTFLQFAVVLLNTILIYMVAGLVFPDFFGEQIDLKEIFTRIAAGFSRWAPRLLWPAFVNRWFSIINWVSRSISFSTRCSESRFWSVR